SAPAGPISCAKRFARSPPTARDGQLRRGARGRRSVPLAARPTGSWFLLRSPSRGVAPASSAGRAPCLSRSPSPSWMREVISLIPSADLAVGRRTRVTDVCTRASRLLLRPRGGADGFRLCPEHRANCRDVPELQGRPLKFVRRLLHPPAEGFLG